MTPKDDSSVRKGRPRAALRILGLAFIVAIAGGCAYLSEKQGELIFRPSTDIWRGYDAAAARSIDEHWIPVGTDSGKLHAWWAPSEQPNAPVLLYLHGARWNLSGSITRIERWRKLGFSVLAIDYRGFGKSSPVSPTEQLSYEDALAGWEYLAKLAPNRKRYVAGHSLGGAIAADLVKGRDDCSGVVLEATFTSIREMVSRSSWSYLPVSLILTQEFDTLSKIGDIRAPIIITHGTNDAIVPVDMGEKLFEAAKSPKRFIKVEGGNHHNLSSVAFEDYRKALKELFAL